MGARVSTWHLRELTEHAQEGLVEGRPGARAGEVRVSYTAHDGRRFATEGSLGACVEVLLRNARPTLLVEEER